MYDQLMGIALVVTLLIALGYVLGANSLTLVILVLVYFALWFCAELWRAWVSAPTYRTGAFNYDGPVEMRHAMWWATWEVIGTFFATLLLAVLAVGMMV